VARLRLGQGDELPAGVKEGLLTASLPLFDEGPRLQVASAWAVGPETVAAWAFVFGDFQGRLRWALVGIAVSPNGHRVLHAERDDDWTAVADGADLIALADLEGDEEPELVTIEPLQSKIGWSQTLTARVYSRSEAGNWRVVQEVPLLHQLWVG